MGFWGSLFGIAPGPTQSAQDFSTRQNLLAQTMNNDFNTRFAGQSQVLQNLNNQLTPIANLGPNQQGFSPEELAAMNTQAINSAGAASRNAQQAVAGTLAGQGGGGTSGLTSGIQQQIKGTIASSAANQLAEAQNQITQQNYATGRENFWRSTAGEQALSSAYNPTAYGQMAQTTLDTAQKSAAQIDAEKQARTNSFAGLLGGVLKTGLGFATGGISNLALGPGSGTSFGENVGNFFRGGYNSLAGNQ